MMRWLILSACTVGLVSFVQADPPKNYYAKATGKTGRVFRSTLHDIIDDHRVIKYSSKNPDTADALGKLDVDPNKRNSVILIYSRRSEAISNFGTSSGWNREHLWCNSYGIDKRGPAYSDLHNLKPADASVNSARSNKIYDNSDTRDAKYQKPGHPEAKLTSEDTDSWEPPAEVRGEISLDLVNWTGIPIEIHKLDENRTEIWAQDPLPLGHMERRYIRIQVIKKRI